MAALLVLAGLALAAVVFFAAAIGLLLKLVFRLIFFPLFLLKAIVSALAMFIVIPVLALVGIVIAFAFGVVAVVFGALFSIPLLPVLGLAALLWVFLVKANRTSAVA